MKSIKKTTQKAKAVFVAGKYVGNERGFGFVISEEHPDVFIPPGNCLGALHGDEVKCKLEPNKKTFSGSNGNLVSGQVTEILKRALHYGTFHTSKDNGKPPSSGNAKHKAYVLPIDGKIPYAFGVSEKAVERLGLVSGHIVQFAVDKKQTAPEVYAKCHVSEIVGHSMDPGIDVLTLVYQAGIPYEFPEEALEEAASIPDSVSEADIAGRLDLRERSIFTIDGDDTKDIDDAISFEAFSDGCFKLGVHIADVAHYVKEETALDTEALRRGTSVYLADRVIPMLPHKLSNGICSLFPNVDRLTLSCLMTISPEGYVTDYEIKPTVIHSKRQWTYNQVHEMLEGCELESIQGILPEEMGNWPKIFSEMDKLRAILRKKRNSKGALDFDLPESKIRVNEEGKPISVEAAPRNRATGIIEEFMILANETVASHGLKLEIPFVFRTHEAPAPDKKTALALFASNLGFSNIFKKSSDAKAFQRLLAIAKNTPSAYAISTAVLHAMPKACYTDHDPTHFGLASTNYSHFTSPIRRYADLLVHRQLKSKNPASAKGKLQSACAHISKCERDAEALERDVAALKKAQFMEDKIGFDFEGIVSGVTGWGVYVMLENTVEGLVRKSELSKRKFYYDKDTNTYVNRRTRKSLRHGTKIKVRVEQVADSKVDFSLLPSSRA